MQENIDSLQVQETAADLAAKRIKPNAEKWDEEEGLPQKILDEMAVRRLSGPGPHQASTAPSNRQNSHSRHDYQGFS